MTTLTRGSGSLLALGVCGALVSLSAIALWAIGLVHTASRVQHTANLAALAASDVSMGVVAGHPCRVARSITQSSGYSLEFCEVVDGISRVVVTVVDGVIPIEKRASARPQPLAGWEGVGE